MLIGVTSVWLVLFGYLLLTSNPPRVPFFTADRVFPAAHLFGSFLLAVQLVVVLTPLRLDSGARRRGLVRGLVASLVFVLGLEIAQEFRPVRGYQLSDGMLNIAGVGLGVAFASLIQRLREGARFLEGSTTVITSVLALVVTVLVVR